jgi:hypothetical protein
MALISPPPETGRHSSLSALTQHYQDELEPFVMRLGAHNLSGNISVGDKFTEILLE